MVSGRFLWSKQTSTSSPPRNCAVPRVQTANSVFQKSGKSDSLTIADRITAFFERMKQALLAKFKSFSDSVSRFEDYYFLYCVHFKIFKQKNIEFNSLEHR